MPDESDLYRRTLEHNKHLDFVRRVLQPESYPVISQDPRLPEGYHASHQMGWTRLEDGTPIVYPNIFYDRQTKSLVWPNPREAAQRAIQTGEYIKFKSDEEADRFSRYYKKGSAGMQEKRK